ncbi:hypothetical protein ACLOJK_022220 [Asimina triloba]
MQEPCSLILVALLVLVGAKGTESLQFFPRSLVSIVNNSTVAMQVKCEDRGGWDIFQEADHRVLDPHAEDVFHFKWYIAFFFKFDIVCSIGAEHWEKKCDLEVYDSHTHYYDCLGEGCRWILSDDRIVHGRIPYMDAGLMPYDSIQWC